MPENSIPELRRIFGLVMDTPAAERSAVLDRECGSDAALRKQIEAMLEATADTRFLTSPTSDMFPESTAGVGGGQRGSSATGLGGSAFPEAPVEGPGTKIGLYKLLQLIGEGGFGSVFMAEQEQPVRRRVALKIIKLGMDTRQVVARFEQERQALALMDHPNIAKVFDAGATETGRPYFAMELCAGEPIEEYCDRHNLSIEERLELFAQVCSAVQHAHTKGIIHRDIKPSNVLVSTHDGKPHAKVIDFGIAKATASRLTEKTLFTEHRQLIGTPEYMSPEQAEGSLDIDTRTDVYSLGVLLYELLTGSTPFDSKELRSAAYAEIQRVIREVDPPRPSTRLSQNAATLASVAARRKVEPRKLGTIVRGELDWIVMKALEKDRTRRYETANGLAMDVRRYLSGEAVVAAPPGAGYRVRKFVRRHRVAVTSGAAIAATLMIGVVAFAWQANVARRQRDRAVAAEREVRQRAEELARVSEFQAKMLSQIDATDAGVQLMSQIRSKFADSLGKAGLPDVERAARIDGFSRDLGRVNATDTAVELINLTILKPAIQAVDAQFKDQPTVDASLRHTVAEINRILGLYGEAKPLQVSALATRRRVLGDLHPETLNSVNNLGSILEALGKFAEAEACYREAIAGRTKVLGPDSQVTLVSVGNLGNLLRSQGKAAEAEPMLRDTLQRFRRVLGDDHRDTLIAINSLGYLLVSQGKLADAEPLWREAYDRGRRVMKPDDPDLVVWVNNLGGLIQAQGRAKEAEPYLREALEKLRRIRGEQHPGTFLAESVMAGNLVRQARYAEAEELARDALAKSRRTLGDDSPDTVDYVSGVANVLLAQGKFDEAEPFVRDALEGKRRIFGNAHAESLDALGQLAKLYRSQGRIADAEAIYTEALATSKRTFGEEHPDTLIFMTNLAGVQVVQPGRAKEAEVLLRRTVELRRKVSGEDHPETLIARSNLAVALDRQGRKPEAAAEHREVLVRMRRVLGDDHPNTIRGMDNLAEVLRAQGKPTEAEPLLRESMQRAEAQYGKDSPRAAGRKIALGTLLVEVGKYQESEGMLLDAERVRSTAPDVSADRREECWRALVSLYTAWDKVEPGKGARAAEWQRRLDSAAATIARSTTAAATSATTRPN